MIGKKNVVFGLIYLVFTAALGPYMLTTMFPDAGAAAAEKQKTLGRLQALKQNNFEEELEPLAPAAIAKANTDGILGLNRLLNARAPIDSMKGGPHAHGNLEALLNVVAGIVLGFLAISPLFKQLISWTFIAGAVLHSGMLYLRAFDVSWASMLLPAGPWLVLAALLMLGVAALVGFKGEIVKD